MLRLFKTNVRSPEISYNVKKPPIIHNLFTLRLYLCAPSNLASKVICILHLFARNTEQNEVLYRSKNMTAEVELLETVIIHKLPAFFSLKDVFSI